VVRNISIVKNSELFVIQGMPANAVAVQDGCVRRQARQNRRGSILFGPVKNIGQCRPVWFIPQVRLARFGSVMMTPSTGC